MNYYSACISILCVTEGDIPEDGYTTDIQVHVFAALNFDEAYKKALEIGYREEQEYKNESKGKVRWVFKEVEAITNLGENIDGKEVSTRMEGYYPPEPLGIDVSFSPEKSHPLYND